MCKYPLLLRVSRTSLTKYVQKPSRLLCLQEIIKYSEEGDLETRKLKDAEEKMQQILTKINVQKRMVDTGATVLDLQERLTNKHGPVPALISPARRFVRHGIVTEVDLATKKVVCLSVLLAQTPVHCFNRCVDTERVPVHSV